MASGARREQYLTPQSVEQQTQRWLRDLAGTRGRRPLPSLDRAALLLVDLQRLFLDPDSPAFLPAWPGVHARCAYLLEFFRSRRRPVIWMRHVNEDQDDGGAIRYFGGRPLRAEDPLSTFARGWSPIGGEAVLKKGRYSAWMGTGLEDHVHQDMVLVVAGVATHRCILATAAEAASRDWLCVVPADGCVATTEGDHQSALRLLAQGFAHVASVDEITLALGGADDDE